MHDNTPIRDRVVNGKRERFCKRHQDWCPLDKFVKAKQGRLGYLGYCRACRKERPRVSAKYIRRGELSAEQLEAVRAADRARYLSFRQRGLSAAEARQLV